jgi:hypothetical protein
VPFSGLLGVGERPSLVAEQFRLHELGGDCSAVHGNERAVAPGAGVVDGAGEQLFAGAGLPLQKNGDVANSDAPRSVNEP